MQVQNRGGCYFVYIFITYRHCKGFFFQPHTLAYFAGCDTHETLIFLLHGFRKRLPVFPFHVVNQTLKSHRVDTISPLPLIMHLHFLAFRAINQDMFHFLRIRFKRSVQIKIIFFTQGL